MSSRRSLSGGSWICEDVEPEVEVLAEAALPDLLLEIAVRGAEHADVHLDLRPPSEPAEPPLLEHAEELRLQLERQLADLVEEERAVVGELEVARAAAAPRR